MTRACRVLDEWGGVDWKGAPSPDVARNLAHAQHAAEHFVLKKAKESGLSGPECANHAIEHLRSLFGGPSHKE